MRASISYVGALRRFVLATDKSVRACYAALFSISRTLEFNIEKDNF